ncbi:MAG: 23S rRNA (adenine(2030)-N(6))-methyltransferase RlmJ [Steroidobacteraceae bacterium]
MTDENGDGYQRLAAWLPPLERRALVLIDPPYEESRTDAQRAAGAATTAIARLAGAVVAVWYPIKLAADAQRWRTALVQRLARPALVSELWLHPCDSRAGLNGSGLLVVNPPYLVAQAMRGWLALLQRLLAPSGRSHHSGHAVLEV